MLGLPKIYKGSTVHSDDRPNHYLKSSLRLQRVKTTLLYAYTWPYPRLQGVSFTNLDSEMACAGVPPG